jgi:hypothetical protein
MRWDSSKDAMAQKRGGGMMPRDQGLAAMVITSQSSPDLLVYLNLPWPPDNEDYPKFASNVNSQVIQILLTKGAGIQTRSAKWHSLTIHSSIRVAQHRSLAFSVSLTEHESVIKLQINTL